jgi:solute carrier family 25 (mitochondrial carnitine/acylcarnitine transporter), member 20/29
MDFDYKRLLPGLAQGLTRVTISYPFDVIKSNMQKLHFETFRGALTYYKKNPLVLYRGSALSYTTVGIERSLQFYYLEKLNTLKYNTYLSGFIVNLCSSVVTMPAQFITTNLTLKTNQLTLKEYISSVIKNKTNPYRGYGIEMIKTQIGSSIFIGTYYLLRNSFGEKTSMSPIYGALSGLSVWCTIFPIDTIKTEYQTTKVSIKNIITTRYNNYGIRSFYKGLSPIIFRTIPSSSLGMLAYETVRKHLE